jgi:hypothetical protein
MSLERLGDSDRLARDEVLLRVAVRGDGCWCDELEGAQ